MRALQQRVQKAVNSEMVLMSLTRYGSKSIGNVEKAIQEVEGQVRTLKLHTEERIGKTIPRPSDHPLDGGIRRGDDQPVQDHQEEVDAAGWPLGANTQ